MRLGNVWRLAVKEWRALASDPMMAGLIIYVLTVSVYAAATAAPETLNKGPIAIVDEDQSSLSVRICNAFYPPYFLPPRMVSQAEMDRRLDEGLDTFALDIPPDFQRDVLAGRSPTLQLNVDATRVSQAFTGSGYVHAIVTGEVRAFVQRHMDVAPPAVELAERVRFNPELNNSWFIAVMQVINEVTMLAIVVTGAALIRERERGTIEHLLAMPVTPLEIMTSKIVAMGLVILMACGASLIVVVQGLLSVPLAGSLPLFFLGAAVHLFAAASLGIFLGTFAGTMPQFELLVILLVLPLEMLSGASTPRESMPAAIQYLMLAAPNTHFVMISQAILFRGADLSVVWPQFLALAGIGALLFSIALGRFRVAIAEAT